MSTRRSSRKRKRDENEPDLNIKVIEPPPKKQKVDHLKINLFPDRKTPPRNNRVKFKETNSSKPNKSRHRKKSSSQHGATKIHSLRLDLIKEIRSFLSSHQGKVISVSDLRNVLHDKNVTCRISDVLYSCRKLCDSGTLMRVSDDGEPDATFFYPHPYPPVVPPPLLFEFYPRQIPVNQLLQPKIQIKPTSPKKIRRKNWRKRNSGPEVPFTVLTRDIVRQFFLNNRGVKYTCKEIRDKLREEYEYEGTYQDADITTVGMACWFIFSKRKDFGLTRFKYYLGTNIRYKYCLPGDEELSSEEELDYHQQEYTQEDVLLQLLKEKYRGKMFRVEDLKNEEVIQQSGFFRGDTESRITKTIKYLITEEKVLERKVRIKQGLRRFVGYYFPKEDEDISLLHEEEIRKMDDDFVPLKE